MTYKVSERFAKLFKLPAVELLVINTTFALAGKIPLTGNGSKIPPPVMVALTFVINEGFVQSPNQGSVGGLAAYVGQVTVSADVFNGEVPVWKNTISS